MKKPLGIFLLSLTLLTPLYAKNTWLNVNPYEKKIETGDFVRIVFDGKRIINYDTENQSSAFMNLSGETLSGEVFGFFPNASVSADDEGSTASSLQTTLEYELTMTAKVLSKTGDKLTLYGYTTADFGGSPFYVEFTGDCSLSDVDSSLSVGSDKLYGLSFTVKNAEKPEFTLDAGSLTFTTNYPSLSTNLTVTEAGLTNTVVSTNLSRFTVELSGISEDAKAEMIQTYLEFLVENLF